MSFERLAPIFPVRDLTSAVEHYRRLGFEVRRYEGDYPYAFARRDDVEIHLNQVNSLRPKRNMSAVYLYVADAHALYEEWNVANEGGSLAKPEPTDYGLLEGASLDGDGNLIRFGSPM